MPCFTEQCTNGVQQLLPFCSVQITLGFMDVSAPIIFCPILGRGEEREDRKKQYFIYIALWQTSQKHQRNGVNPTLKQKCWSAERKRHPKNLYYFYF